MMKEELKKKQQPPEMMKQSENEELEKKQESDDLVLALPCSPRCKACYSCQDVLLAKISNKLKTKKKNFLKLKIIVPVLTILFIMYGTCLLICGLYLEYEISGPTRSILTDMNTVLKQIRAVGTTVDKQSVLDLSYFINEPIGFGASCIIIGLVGVLLAFIILEVAATIYGLGVGVMFISTVIFLKSYIGMEVTQPGHGIFSQIDFLIELAYAGPMATNTESVLLNTMMIQFQCCGIDSYIDFKTVARLWNRTQDLSSFGIYLPVNQTLPVQCCKMQGLPPNISPIDPTCVENATTVNSNMETGCRLAAELAIDDYKSQVSTVYLVNDVCWILLMFGAIKLIHKILFNKNKTGPKKDAELITVKSSEESATPQTTTAAPTSSATKDRTNADDAEMAPVVVSGEDHNKAANGGTSAPASINCSPDD